MNWETANIECVCNTDDYNNDNNNNNNIIIIIIIIINFIIIVIIIVKRKNLDRPFHGLACRLFRNEIMHFFPITFEGEKLNEM